jgi:two-component system cell cycle sensor histidine kinase/response regulator CckA
MLSVSDSGSGIGPETLAHIFEPFFTTKEQGKGTGLGLATVYGIVKQSEGYIWVKTVLEQGTTFEIYLPRIEEPVSLREPNAPTGETTRRFETILLVEDSEALRKLAAMLLGQHGYRVLSAANGAEALERTENTLGRIDLLLTDVIMPGLNGCELAKRILLTQPGLKVLYMSGYTDDAIASQAGVGVGTFLLSKPFSEEDLIRKVHEVLSAGQTTPSAVDPPFVLAEA